MNDILLAPPGFDYFLGETGELVIAPADTPTQRFFLRWRDPLGHEHTEEFLTRGARNAYERMVTRLSSDTH